MRVFSFLSLQATLPKLDKKLIAKGNMDSISMSAKDRVDFMEKHGYQYAKEEYKQNDITLRDSSTSQLQAMKDTIEIIKLSKEKSNRNKSKIEGKIRDVVKSIPNLDLSGMQKVLKIIRKAIKSEDDRAIPEAIDKISDYLRLRGLSDDQIESYIRPLRIGMSGLSANKAVNNAMDQDIANRSEYLKKNFNFNHLQILFVSGFFRFFRLLKQNMFQQIRFFLLDEI